MIKGLIAGQIRSLVGSGRPPTEYLNPPRDPGLFGPNSMVWEIHRDFTSMMIGGISSLILQAQHPLALAGVWDHSNFRQDLRGRLKRTAYFIAATTYGGKDMAMAAIKRVKTIHDHLRGTLPDGRTYWVSDPKLLYWVHLTEASSFLNAYETFMDRSLDRSRKDQYFSEMSIIAKALGCEIVDKNGQDCFARTYAKVMEDLSSYIPELEYSERARIVLDMIEHAPSEPHLYMLNKLIIKAGFYNLPEWVYPIIKRPIPTRGERDLVNNAVRLMAKPVRWALNDGIYAHAKRRMMMSQ